MARLALGLAAALTVLGLAWWLLRGDNAPTAPALLPGDAGETLAPPELTGRERPVPTPEPGEPAPHAGVTDPQALLAHLAHHATAEDATARVKELVGSDTQRIRAFLRMLHPDERPPDVRWGHTLQHSATAVLLAAGDPAIDALIEELDDANAVHRATIAAFLGEFGERAARAVPRLLRQLDEVPEDPPSREAAAVVYALGFIGPAAKDVLPDLQRWLDEGVTQEVEVAAAHAFIRIGGATTETFELCRALLREEHWPLQRSAVLAELAGMKERAQPMIPFLIKLVEDGAMHESTVLHALGRMGVADPQLLEYLAAKFRATAGAESYAGLYGATLAQLGENGLSLLLRLSAEGGPRRVAGLPFAFRGRPEHYARMLRAMEPAFTAAEDDVRVAAYGALAHLNAIPDALEVPVLLRGLRDEHAGARRVCASMSQYVEPLPVPLARLVFARLEDPEEDLEVASECASCLSRREGWITQRLLDAVLALHGRHPTSAAVLVQLHPFVKTHTETVLKAWAAAVAARTVHWSKFAGALGHLPPEALEPYPEAREAVEKIRGLRR